MEVTVNVQALEELKRVLSGVPAWEFNIARWHECACGHATRDAWFRRQGFTTCYSFADSAAFFGISRKEAVWAFSGQAWVSPQDVIQRIDALLAKHAISNEEAKQARRQAVIDDLLARATKAAQKAKAVATTVVAVFF
jgi:hypothetical protein